MATRRRAEWLKGRRKERADALFTIYWQMGAERSLVKLAALCSTAGVKTSIQTITRYSKDFGWQRKLLEMDQYSREAREREAIEEVAEMNRRHVQMAQGMIGIAFAGMKRFRTLITQASDGAVDMSIDDMVKLYRAAQTGERLARGEATSRVEVWMDVVETVVKEFGLIFMAVNEIDVPEERQNEFIRLSDDMIRRYYRSNVKELQEGA